MIPALTFILIIMICGFLPALNLVGEKESGTIEQINVSPVGRMVFTLSKLIPYWIIGVVVLTLAMVIARSVYIKGSYFADQWPNFAALAGFALVLNVIAAVTYRKQS